MIGILKNKIKILLKISINQFWTKKIENISIRDNNRLFHKINPIFRPLKKQEIPNLVIPNSNDELLKNAKLKESDYTTKD